MTSQHKKNIGWTFVGFLTAFITISLFEFANSLLFPFPPGMDTYDLNAIRQFAQSMPSTLFVIVLIGWVVGTILASLLILHKVKSPKHVYVCAGILTFMALINNFVILPGVHPLWFHIIGLPLFMCSAYITVVVYQKYYQS
jgi:uncharacterized membrane protein YsdA (DUF1294 family)